MAADGTVEDRAVSDGTVAEVMALFADYARHLDLKRDPDAWAGLFTPDGSLVTSDRQITGTTELRAFAAGSLPGVHVQSVPWLQARPDGGLDAVTSFIFMTVQTHDFRSGYYTDRLVRRHERLVFASRQISMLTRTD